MIHQMQYAVVDWDPAIFDSVVFLAMRSSESGGA